MIFYTFSPICVPVNWQTELITSTHEKLRILTGLLDDFPGVSVNACEWPIGYGSLEHDNLPLFYQVGAEISLQAMMQEDDVVDARLYCYDNCLAVLAIVLETAVDLGDVDDLAISERIGTLSTRYLKPILSHLYKQEGTGHFISPKSYKVYADTPSALCDARPLWVARMLVQSPELPPSHYHHWLQRYVGYIIAGIR